MNRLVEGMEDGGEGLLGLGDRKVRCGTEDLIESQGMRELACLHASRAGPHVTTRRTR